MQGVLPVFHGDQAVAHQKILVALVLNSLLKLVPVHLADGRVRVLSRAGVLAAVRDILGRLIELREGLFSQLLIHFKEPVGVKASVVKLLRRERRVSCDHRFLAVVEALVHMRHEVVTAAREAVYAEHLFYELHPLRRVHGHFDQAVVGNLACLHSFLQIFRCLCLHGAFRIRGLACAFGYCGVRARCRQKTSLLDRIRDFEQVGQALSLAGSAYVGIISAAVQRILAQGPQDLHETRDPFNAGNAEDCVREDSRRIAALQFHIQDQTCEIAVELRAQFVEAALSVDRPLFHVDRHELLKLQERGDDEDRSEQVSQLAHSELDPHHVKGRLIEEVLADHALFIGLHIRQHGQNIARAVGITARGAVLLELIDLVHLIEQRECAAEFAAVLIMASAREYGAELIGPHKAHLVIAAVIYVFGRCLLHPADVLRQLQRLQDRRLRHLHGQDQMLDAGDDVQDRLVNAMPSITSHEFGIIVVIARIGLAENSFLSLAIGFHIFN